MRNLSDVEDESAQFERKGVKVDNMFGLNEQKQILRAMMKNVRFR